MRTRGKAVAQSSAKSLLLVASWFTYLPRDVARARPLLLPAKERGVFEQEIVNFAEPVPLSHEI